MYDDNTNIKAKACGIMLTAAASGASVGGDQTTSSD